MHRLGVCSWSLQPTSARDLVEKVRACGLDACQLALDPLRNGQWPVGEVLAELRAGSITLLAGMIEMEGEDYSTLASIRATGGVLPDATWERNLERARAHAALCEQLSLQLVSFHAGFLPQAAGDPVRVKMLERLRALAEVFGAKGVQLALETGPESAETLAAALHELGSATIGVNFDPANLILYGTDEPVAALQQLGSRVRQVHVKDAVPAGERGAWGKEVVAGTGAVEWERFFRILAKKQPDIALVIERESGTDRIADVIAARELVERHRPQPT